MCSIWCFVKTRYSFDIHFFIAMNVVLVFPCEFKVLLGANGSHLPAVVKLSFYNYIISHAFPLPTFIKNQNHSIFFIQRTHWDIFNMFNVFANLWATCLVFNIPEYITNSEYIILVLLPAGRALCLIDQLEDITVINNYYNSYPMSNYFV
jgi:hypothetical protein